MPGASAEGADRRRQFRIALYEGGEAGGCTDAALDFGAFSEGVQPPLDSSRSRA